jgi:cysteine desulfurase
VTGAENYFDHAATTPVDPAVLSEMLRWMAEDFGNANSLHHWGRKAWAAVERAREAVAELVDAADPGEIVFTSGATEANNWVLAQFPQAVVSPFEHSSVREPALAGGMSEAWNLDWHLKAPVEPSDLLSAMLVNNETGCLVDVSSWFQVGPGAGPKHIHRDVTQAAGRLPLHDHPYDLGTFSAHKFYGPKGVGALHMRGINLDHPFLHGGEQEGGLRGGTLNVPAIVGMGAAASLALERMEEDWAQAEELRAAVLEVIRGVPDHRVMERENLPGRLGQVPHILSVAFKGVEGETLTLELDARGFGVSSGAACSSRSTEPSHVLTALALEPEWIRGTVRISFGRSNTLDSARQMAHALGETVERLRQLAQS